MILAIFTGCRLTDRDLNYSKYFFEGEVKTSEIDDYNSHNTTRLDVEGTKKLLLGLDFIQQELKGVQV